MARAAHGIAACRGFCPGAPQAATRRSPAASIVACLGLLGGVALIVAGW